MESFKHRILGLSLLLILLAATGAQAQPTKQSFLWQGSERNYYSYVPDDYTIYSDPLPVLVFLHGFDGGIDSYDSNIDFQQAADQFGWMIVLPEALSASVEFMGMNVPIGNAWNSGIVMTLMGNSFTPNSDVDDAGFLLALVDSLGTAYNLNADSLFFAGFSMGAFMTYRMAIEHSDRIAGVAAASGLIPLCFADSIPAGTPDVLHIHGTDDNMIAPDGTASPVPGMGSMTLGLSVDSTIGYWIHHNQCNTAATSNTYADTEDDGMTFTLHTHEGGSNGSRVAFLSVDGGKHQWYEEGHDVQYLTVIHDFFTHGQSYSFAGLPAPTHSDPLRVFPNPADSTITIASPSNTRLFLYGADGRAVATLPLSAGDNVVDISSYPAGLYLLRTPSGQTSSLIIQ